MKERERERERWGARLFNNKAISDSKVNHSEDMENIIEILKNNSHVKWTIFSSFLEVWNQIIKNKNKNGNEKQSAQWFTHVS